MQLHRDVTVAALTQTPTLEGGTLVWEDSPLVRALTHANEALARELDRRWHALLALLGAIEGCALVGCALYERRR